VRPEEIKSLVLAEIELIDNRLWIKEQRKLAVVKRLEEILCKTTTVCLIRLSGGITTHYEVIQRTRTLKRCNNIYVTWCVLGLSVSSDTVGGIVFSSPIFALLLGSLGQRAYD